MGKLPRKVSILVAVKKAIKFTDDDDGGKRVGEERRKSIAGANKLQ